MKQILKLMVGLFFLPFLILGGIIVLVKVLLVSTLGLAWGKSNDWYGELLEKLSAFLGWIEE